MLSVIRNLAENEYVRLLNDRIREYNLKSQKANFNRLDRLQLLQEIKMI